MEALGINLSGLVTQIVSFVILFALLWKLLYKPVLRVLDQRSERIRESLEASQRAQEEAARSQQEMETQLSEARSEGQQLIAQAQEVADRHREAEFAKVEEEIVVKRSRAEATIRGERDAAREALRREFAGLAIFGAEQVIEREIDGSDHAQLLHRILDEGPKLAGRN